MEIRRSVMARPNLSVRGTGESSLVVCRLSLACSSLVRPTTNDHRLIWKERRRRKHPGRRFLSNAFFENAGGADISARTLGLIFFANFAGVLANFAVKSF